jgi:hypothetical protein
MPNHRRYSSLPFGLCLGWVGREMREIRCAACGALNRVRDYSFTRISQCGKDGCGARLPESTQTKIVRFLYRFSSRATPLLLTAGALSFLWFISQGERSTQPAIPAKSEPAVACVAQAAPPQGEYESTRPAPMRVRQARME